MVGIHVGYSGAASFEGRRADESKIFEKNDGNSLSYYGGGVNSGAFECFDRPVRRSMRRTLPSTRDAHA